MAKQTKKKRSLAALAPEADPRTPLDSELLLAAARPILAGLEADLARRAKASPALTRALKARHAIDCLQEWRSWLHSPGSYARWRPNVRDV